MSGWLIAWFVFGAVVVLLSGGYYLTKEVKAELPPGYDQKKQVRTRIVVYVIVIPIVFSCVGWILYDMGQ